MEYCCTPMARTGPATLMLGERVQGALDRWAYLWLQGVQVTCGDWWPLVPTGVDNLELPTEDRALPQAEPLGAGRGPAGPFSLCCCCC